MKASDPASPATRQVPSQLKSTYSERLVPGVWIYVMWLLLIPAVLLAATPLSEFLALPVALSAYVIVILSFVLMAPTIQLQGTELSAGSAKIDVSMIGEIELLDRETLRYAIGQGTDIRNFLVIRGYIHSGVRIEITDINDPTPHWIITTRRPAQLKAALLAAQAKL